MADTPGPCLHRCPVCFKTYKRREHLQRHRSTHTSERPHRCILCNASFQRTDVLKRHLQTCDGVSNASAGRRRACDRCVRQKKACNSAQPCLNCEKRSVECIYSITPTAAPVAAHTITPTPAPTNSISSLGPALQSNAPSLSNEPAQDDSQSLCSSAVLSTRSSNLDDTASSTTTFDDVPYDDLDALIQEAVSTFPVLNGQPQIHPAPHGWLNLDFSDHHGRPDHSHPQHLLQSHQHPQPYQPQHLQQQHQSYFPPHNGPRSDDQDYEREPFQRELSTGATSTSSEYRGYSFGFLYDFTSRTGLVSSFECATLEQRQQIVAEFNRSYLAQQHPHFLGAGPTLFAPFEEPNPAGLTVGSLPAGQVLSSWNLWLQNPIVIKLQQVVLLIKNVVTVKPANSTITLTWSLALEQRCLQFFTPSRFAKFIELYWAVWHPNVNFLHKPTFDPTTTKSILLAGMALIGACVSPDPVDNEDAKMWFNCVEEMVFTDDDFCRDVEPEITSQISILASRRKLQALQAAVVVCLYQNWEGTDAGKRRIRRHRFSTVVSAARDMGIETARHIDYHRQFKHEFNWIEYVVREELIRTFMWIFLIDTAFVIFNNLPHRIVIKEMKMHMASPEACFQAATAEECFEEIHTWMHAGSPFCDLYLRRGIETLCGGPMSSELQYQYSSLGPLNLFAMVSAIHYMIFQHQNLFGVEGQLIPIRQALQNWISIWEMCFDSSATGRWPHGLMHDESLMPDTMWKRMGFVRYSAEYWLLGSLLINRLTSRSDMHRDQGMSPPDLTGAHGKAKTVEPILEKYDQTSMRQVNDLITDFQKFNVDEASTSPIEAKHPGISMPVLSQWR
ncbi:hypothetical protein QBC43DRAFT_293281 [Cladorrhinum sp. PSN259]|nr:hypothetical protein QBC43DRAFT_293281 [Cladorrhinum sp. PSN259]